MTKNPSSTEWIPSAVVKLDSQLQIVEWNQYAAEIYGYPVDQVAGESILSFVSVNFRTPFLQMIGTLCELTEWSGDLQMQSMSGRPLRLQSRWQLLGDGSLVGVLAEIGERRNEEKRRREADAWNAARRLALGLAKGLRRETGSTLPDQIEHFLQSGFPVESGIYRGDDASVLIGAESPMWGELMAATLRAAGYTVSLVTNEDDVLLNVVDDANCPDALILGFGDGNAALVNEIRRVHALLSIVTLGDAVMGDHTLPEPITIPDLVQIVSEAVGESLLLGMAHR